VTTSFWVPLNVIQVVTGVGACIRTEVQATPAGDVRRYVAMQPGDVAWDACDCGLLAQSIISEFPADTLAAQTSGTPRGNCGPPLVVVSVQVHLIRCVPVSSDAGVPPTPAKLVESAVNQAHDAYALRKGALCCLAGYRRERPSRITNFEVGAVTRVGPSGACGGLQMSYQFGLHNAFNCCG